MILLGVSVAVFAQRKSKSNEAGPGNVLSENDTLQVQYLFFNGLREKSVGNYELAADYLRQALEIDNNPAIMYELAYVFSKMGKKEDALGYAKDAVKLEPKNEWYLVLLGTLYEQKNEFNEAAEIYERLIVLFPDRVDYYFDQASMLLYAQKYNEAIKIYDKLEGKIGLNDEVSIQKQKIYLKLNKVDKAIAEIEKLISNNPKEPRYLLILAELYSSAKMEDKMMETYKKILEVDPQHPYANLAMADHYRSKGNKAESYKNLKIAFGNRFLDIDHKVRILSAYFNTMEDPFAKTEAFELSEILVTAHGSEAKAFAIYGDFLYQDKQFKEAREQYYKALKLNDQVFAVWQNVLFINSELNDYERTLKDSEDALTLFPNQVILYYFNGLAKSQLKKYQEAIDAYNNGLALGTDNPDLEAQFYANMGDAYHSLDKFKESDDAYEQSLQIRPNQQFVLNNYSYYLSIRGEQLDKAERMSRLSNQLEPENSSFQDTYAWILYRMHRYEEARVWIEKAIVNGGDKSPTIMEHYGDILFRLGQNDLAILNWKKAREFGAKSETLDKKITDKKLYE